MVSGEPRENKINIINNKECLMKTLTIKQKELPPLDTDLEKIEFADSVKAILFGSEPNQTNEQVETLQKGLNDDIPEPMKGAPEFDSSNMTAPEYRRYSLARGGYVPKWLHYGYAEYEYIHLSELSERDFESRRKSAVSDIKYHKGKRDHVKFLQYLCSIYTWFFTKKICHL